MHPEIVRDGPGACPICGMALEPTVITLESGPNPELVDMTRRFWVAAALAMPVFVLTMADMATGGTLLMSRAALMNWVGLAFSTPVVFWAGRPFFERAWMSLLNRSPNMFTLIALGTGSAYIYSLVATIAPVVFPDSPPDARRGGDLLRHRGGDHRAGAARPGAGTSRARPDQFGDPATARPRTEDGPRDPRR